MITFFMKSIILKVDEKIPQELDLIQAEEGLGNRTATVTFLIKYYFLTKKNSLSNSLQILDKFLGKIDVNALPSTRTQLKDL